MHTQGPVVWAHRGSPQGAGDPAPSPADRQWAEASGLLLGLGSASARKAISRLSLDGKDSTRPEFRFPFMEWVAADHTPHVSCRIAMQGMDSLQNWLGGIAAASGVPIDASKQREMILFHEMAHCEAIAMVRSAEHDRKSNVFSAAYHHFGWDGDPTRRILPWLPGAAAELRTLVWERHADARAVFMAAQRVFARRADGTGGPFPTAPEDAGQIASRLLEFEAYARELVTFRFFERAGSERDRPGAFQDHDTMGVLSIAIDIVRQAALDPMSTAATIDPDRASEVAMQIALGSVRAEFAGLQADLLRSEIERSTNASGRQRLAEEVQEIEFLHERLREHVRFALGTEADNVRREVRERSSRLAVEAERLAGYGRRLQAPPVPLHEALSRFPAPSAHRDAVERADDMFGRFRASHRTASATICCR